MRWNGLHFELDARPADLTPTRQVDYASRAISAFTAAPLFRSGEWDMPVEAGLLMAAESNASGAVWRLRSRAGNVWSSGRAMTLADVADSLARPKADPLGRSMRAPIRRTVVDDDEIVVELARPLACFPAMLAADVFALGQGSGERADDTAGPYTLMGGINGRTFGLARNAVGERTWPDGPETIVFIVSDSPDQGIRLFERGLIDVTSNPNLPGPLIDKYRPTGLLRQRDLLLAGVLLVAPALRVAAARSFRRGLYAAVSREAIALKSHGALAPLYDLVDLWGGPASAPVCTNASNETFPFARDRPLTIGYADFEPNGDVVRHIAEGVASKLGIGVIPKPLSYDDYLTCLSSPDCDLIYSLIQPAFNDPTSLLATIRTFVSSNIDDDAVGRAIQQAESTFDPGERLEASRATMRQLMEDMPIIPIVRAHTRCLVSARGRALALGADGVFRPPAMAQVG